MANPEQRRQAGFIGVQEDADEEQQTGHGIVLKHHLPDAAQQGVDHSDCRVHVRHVSPGARPNDRVMLCWILLVTARASLGLKIRTARRHRL